MHGKGALVYPNGEKYEGDFQHGKRHGFGVYSYSDGGRFEGEWVDDKVHGRGVSVYASGNRCARAARCRRRDAGSAPLGPSGSAATLLCFSGSPARH